MKNRQNGSFASMLGALALGISVQPETVLAQLEEVVVTATRRSESLQDVPIAVSAFSADAMDAMGLGNVSELGDFTPNVTLDSTAPISGSSSVLVSFIRGIGQSDYAMNYEPGVGLYVDGIYYARNVGSNVGLADVERVEILKGPQGTLFGRNTIGGAINVITRRPEPELGGSIEITAGAFDRQDVSGLINLPLTDTLLTSISFTSMNRDGFVDRVPYTEARPADVANFRALDGGILDDLPNGNDLGNQNSDAIRGKLLWLASDRVEVTFAADYTRTRENAAPSTLVDAEQWITTGGIAGLYNNCVSGAPIPVCGSITNGLTGQTIDPLFTERTPYDNRFLTQSRETNFGNSISGTALDAWGASATIDWNFGASMALKSITAVRAMDSVFGEDADMSPLVIDHHAFELNQEQFSQELQLSGNSERLEWLAGVYYFTEEGENNDYVPLAGGLFQVFGPNDIENTSYAAFGRAGYDLTDRLTLTVGGRWTREEKEFEGRQRDLNDLSRQFGAPLQAFPDPTDTTRLFPLGVQEQNFSNFTGLLSIDYQFSDDVLAYASFSQGFKGGGWDSRLTGPELTAPAFDEEEADSYELGLKSYFLDRSLKLNLALFYTEYENLQLIVQRGISPLTANAGESEIQGAELDLSWAPNDALTVTAAYGYIDAEYTKLDARANEVGIFLDNAFNNTPEHEASFAIDYRQELAAGGSLRYHVDYAWKDDHFNDAVNTPQLEQEAFGLLNASLRYNAEGGRWSAAFGVRNLADENYIMSGFNQPGVGFIYQTLGRPREWWASLSLDF